MLILKLEHDIIYCRRQWDFSLPTEFAPPGWLAAYCIANCPPACADRGYLTRSASPVEPGPNGSSLMTSHPSSPSRLSDFPRTRFSCNGLNAIIDFSRTSRVARQNRPAAPSRRPLAQPQNPNVYARLMRFTRSLFRPDHPRKPKLSRRRFCPLQSFRLTTFIFLRKPRHYCSLFHFLTLFR